MTYVPGASSGVLRACRSRRVFSTHSNTAAFHSDAFVATLPNDSPEDTSLVRANASQPSQLGISSTGSSGPLHSGMSTDVPTLSSSTSNNSDQGYVPSVRSANGPDIQHDERAKPYLSTTAPLYVTLEDGSIRHNGGSKRTTTGQIKSPLPESLPTSPVGISPYGHSRTTSTSSRSVFIGEVRYSATRFWLLLTS